MKTIFFILKQRASFVKTVIRGERKAPKFVFFVFAGIFALLMMGEFFGFLRGFLFLFRQEFFGPPLTLFIIEEFILFIMALFVLSSALLGFFAFFRSPDHPFLLSTPLGSGDIFLLKFFETAIISSWPLVVIGLPLTLALGIARGDGLLYYGLGVILFGAFLLLASSFSTLLDFFASFLLRFVRPWLFTVLSLLVLFLAGSGIVGVLVPRASVLEVVFEATNLNDATANTSLISGMFSRFPSHWFANVLFWASEKPATALEYLLLALLSGGVLFAALFFFARRFYRAEVLSWQESHFYADGKRKEAVRSSAWFSNAVRRMTPGTFGSLLSKDILSLSRNYEDLSRAVFILFLLFIYLVAIVSSGRRIGGAFAGTEGIVLTLHLIAVAYFATTLSLRFVFPSISLEGRSAWIIWSSPVSRAYIFWEKLLLYGVLFFALTEFLLFITASSFNLSSSALLVSSIFLFFIVMTITSLSLAVGTIYPDFHETSADSLATSAPGLAVTFISLLYGVFMGIINFRVIAYESNGLFGPWMNFALLVSMLLMVSAIYAGIQKIQRLEVV